MRRARQLAGAAVAVRGRPGRRRDRPFGRTTRTGPGRWCSPNAASSGSRRGWATAGSARSAAPARSRRPGSTAPCDGLSRVRQPLDQVDQLRGLRGMVVSLPDQLAPSARCSACGATAACARRWRSRKSGHQRGFHAQAQRTTRRWRFNRRHPLFRFGVSRRRRAWPFVPWSMLTAPILPVRRPAPRSERAEFPGDTRRQPWEPPDATDAQRRPELKPRRHMRRWWRDRWPYLTAQRRPELKPRRHLIERLRHEARSQIRSTKAGAQAPATHDSGIAAPDDTSKVAQRRPELKPRRHPRPAPRRTAFDCSWALNEGRSSSPGDTHDRRILVFNYDLTRSTKAGAQAPATLPEHWQMARCRRSTLNEGRSSSPGDTP